jgi:hypothetical protein
MEERAPLPDLVPPPDDSSPPPQPASSTRRATILLAVVAVLIFAWQGMGSTHGGSPGGGEATVEYVCTGSGPVNITYGAEGSQISASELPFDHTDTVSSAAQYVSVSAQLQGAGSVSCSTTVTWGNHTATKAAMAEGGYSIALAEVCSGGDGWQAC